MFNNIPPNQVGGGAVNATSVFPGQTEFTEVLDGQLLNLLGAFSDVLISDCNEWTVL